jgi:hypothetical protein
MNFRVAPLVAPFGMQTFFDVPRLCLKKEFANGATFKKWWIVTKCLKGHYSRDSPIFIQCI